MKTKVFKVIVLTFIISCIGCSKKELTVHQMTPPKIDFSFLKDALQGKKVVAIGESSRGLGDLTMLKSMMVMYMHEELGYDVLMLEAGYGDVNLAWNNIDKTKADGLRNGTALKHSRSEQIMPLFTYIKNKSESKDPLIYAGFDSQLSGGVFDYKLNEIIASLEPKIIQDSIKRGFNSIEELWHARDDREEWTKYKGNIQASIDLSRSIFEDNAETIVEDSLVTPQDFKIIKETIDGYEKLISYNYGEAPSKGLAIRDSLMAANVINQIKEKYPNKKIVIWGHNGHIQNANGTDDPSVWMGHYLKEEYGDAYYSIGAFVKKGQYYQYWTKKAGDFDLASSYYIEGLLSEKYGQNVFVELPKYDSKVKSWENYRISSFEPEAGGKVTFIPSQRFDALLLLYNSTATKVI